MVVVEYDVESEGGEGGALARGHSGWCRGLEGLNAGVTLFLTGVCR